MSPFTGRTGGVCSRGKLKPIQHCVKWVKGALAAAVVSTFTGWVYLMFVLSPAHMSEMVVGAFPEKWETYTHYNNQFWERILPSATPRVYVSGAIPDYAAGDPESCPRVADYSSLAGVSAPKSACSRGSLTFTATRWDWAIPPRVEVAVGLAPAAVGAWNAVAISSLLLSLVVVPQWGTFWRSFGRGKKPKRFALPVTGVATAMYAAISPLLFENSPPLALTGFAFAAGLTVWAVSRERSWWKTWKAEKVEEGSVTADVRYRKEHPWGYVFTGVSLYVLTSVVTVIVASTQPEFSTDSTSIFPLWYILSFLLAGAGVVLATVGVGYATAVCAKSRGVAKHAWWIPTAVTLTAILLLNAAVS